VLFAYLRLDLVQARQLVLALALLSAWGLCMEHVHSTRHYEQCSFMPKGAPCMGQAFPWPMTTTVPQDIFCGQGAARLSFFLNLAHLIFQRILLSDSDASECAEVACEDKQAIDGAQSQFSDINTRQYMLRLILC
jgi:hypothetical protein